MRVKNDFEKNIIATAEKVNKMKKQTLKTLRSNKFHVMDGEKREAIYRK